MVHSNQKTTVTITIMPTITATKSKVTATAVSVITSMSAQMLMKNDFAVGITMN